MRTGWRRHAVVDFNWPEAPAGRKPSASITTPADRPRACLIAAPVNAVSFSIVLVEAMPPKSFFSRLGIHHRDRKAKDSEKSKSKHDVDLRPTSSTSQSTTITETCSADISYIPTPPTNVNLNSPQDAAGPASSVHRPVPPWSPVLPPPPSRHLTSPDVYYSTYLQ